MRIWHFLMMGGWAIGFVLAFGAITLAAAAGFARRPAPARLGAVRSFSRATTLAIMSAVSLNLAAVGLKVPSIPELASSPRIHLVILEGIGESLVPAIVGFALLSFAWIVTAVGQRRLARER